MIPNTSTQCNNIFKLKYKIIKKIEIKGCLIHLYRLSNYQKVETLINLPFTSDTTPFVLKSSMLNLYPQEVQTGFCFHWFIPPLFTLSIRDHLLALDLDENPDGLAKKANP